jgi:hypothetical protein
LTPGAHSTLSAMPGIKEEEECAQLTMTSAEDRTQPPSQQCPSETTESPEASREDRERSVSTLQQCAATAATPDNDIPTQSLAIFDPGSRSIQGGTSPCLLHGLDCHEKLEFVV